MLVERKDPEARENRNGSGSQGNESPGSLGPDGETPKASGNERRKHPFKGMGGIPVLQGNTAPLSFSQQRLWFFHRMNPQSPMYHMPIGFRLQGELDVHAFEKSLRAVLHEHDIFRTNYRMRDDDQLIQIVDDSCEFKLELLDFSNSGETAQEQLEKFKNEFIVRPFNLARDLMLRAALTRIHARDHLLILVFHHISFDAWSMRIFFEDVSRHYEACLLGKTPNPGRTGPGGIRPLQYRDFAAWQRRTYTDKFLAEDVAYWADQLKGAPTRLDLPTDFPRPRELSHRGAQVSLRIPDSIAQNLRQMASARGCTPFMLYFAVVNTLLHRHTHQQDLIVGAPVAGRGSRDVENVIGFFVNTLPIRSRLDPNLPFSEFLDRTRETILDNFSHQNLPFEKLVEHLKPDRSEGRHPLFQAVMAYQNLRPVTGMKLQGLEISQFEYFTNTSKFELLIALTEIPGVGLDLVLEYDTDLFCRETMEGMASHFESLLQGVLKAPGTSIGRLPLLGAIEQEKVIRNWNQTKTPYPSEAFVHQLVEEQARANPHATALIFGNRSLTYQQLDQRANQIARQLSSWGVGAHQLVGLALDRSPEMITLLIGILKAGAAYVSLDPSYPAGRIEAMLNDARPALLVLEGAESKIRTTEGDERNLKDLPTRVIRLKELLEGASSHSTAPLANPVSAARSRETAAYVSYTSGSTGTPKGVVVTHRGVVRLVKNSNYFPFKDRHTFLQLAPVCFDASTFEIWGALANGSSLVIMEPGIPSLSALAETIRKYHVSALWLTSGLFNQMVEEELDGLKNVKFIITGGDVLSVPHIRKAFVNLEGCRLINGYGPTENTTFSCCHEITRLPPENRGIPIGRPISNSTAYVLDSLRQPVPAGVVGELYVGGDGLALGYWGKPEWTREKFMDDPFLPGERIYRTGDLARWLPDGTLEFLGRVDHQVKIRGFRIEPAEIESVLLSHGSVKTAVVLPISNQGEKCLVVYYVATESSGVTGDELATYLGRQLPDYMVPCRFVQLSKLPINTNGKVDRQQLPNPFQTEWEKTPGSTQENSNGCLLTSPDQRGRVRQRPCDDVERAILSIWEEVLNRGDIGTMDRFFEVGGHSLLAVKLISRIEKRLQCTIPVKFVFRSPTVREMAGYIRGENSSSGSHSLVALRSNGAKSPMVFIHGVGGGNIWGYTNLSRHLDPERPVYVIKSRGLEGYREYDTIEEMAAHYLDQLRSLQPKGPYYLGGYCFGGVVAYEMARRLAQTGEEIGLLALLNCSPPNSSYSNYQLNLPFLYHFSRNLAGWAVKIWNWDARQKKDFIRWKHRSVKRRAEQLFRRRPRDLSHADTEIDDLVDLSMYKEDQKKLWEQHIQALMKYHPLPYPGEITLFRTSGHRLLCSFDEDFGWGEMAKHVRTVMVPGSHETILKEPHVQVVAAEISRRLNFNPDSRGGDTRPTQAHFNPPRTQDDWRIRAFILKGRLDRAALESSLGELIRRHHLVTNTSSGPQPHSDRFAPGDLTDLVQLDISSLQQFHSSGTKAEAIHAFLENECRGTLTGESPVPFKIRIVRCGTREHLLVFGLQLNVFDEDTMDLLLMELTLLYQAKRNRPGMDLKPLSPTALAHTVAVRSHLDRQAMPLVEEPDVLAIPSMPLGLSIPAKEAGEITTRHGQTESILDTTSSIRLRNLAIKTGCTPEEVVLSAFIWMIHRHSDGHQISFLLNQNRRNSGNRDLAGNFERWVPVHIEIPEADVPLERIIESIRFSTLKASARDAHSECQLQGLSRSGGQSETHQGCRITFKYRQPKGQMHRSILGLETREVPSPLSPRSWYDLGCFITDRDGKFEICFSYNPFLFAGQTPRRMLERFQHILMGMGERAFNQNMRSLRTLTDWDIQVMSGGMPPNDKSPTSESRSGRCIHTLFLDQAIRSPRRAAVVHNTSEVTYGTLHKKATEVSRLLASRGVRAGDRVGILMDRTPDLLASILGIMMTGAASVPLDQRHPRERLKMIVEDAEPLLIACSSTELLQLASDLGSNAVDVAHFEEVNLECPPLAQDSGLAAYIIYTSGSTGKPKGVVVEHRSVCHLLDWARETFAPHELSGVFAATSHCFDLSIFEMFAPLTTGGTIILGDHALQLPHLPARNRVRLINTVPSAITELLRINGIPKSVVTINLAGEALDTALVDRIYQEAPHIQQVNDLYGPTETTVYSTHSRRYAGRRPTIGRPLPGEQVYILDHRLDRVPVGVKGEIHIAGAGLARGYWRRPDLTNERFIPNPFGKPGEKLYRTGDLGRYLENGEIEYLGRADHQVKIRGFRIETGEIESVLRQHPGIRNALVVADHAPSGGQRLLAYFVPESEAPDPSILRAHLRKTLPEYMIPAAFVPITEFPLNSNGKIDRKVLPKPPNDRCTEAEDSNSLKGGSRTASCKPGISETTHIPRAGGLDMNSRLLKNPGT
jgi:amino acid adenylation domain-containing protein